MIAKAKAVKILSFEWEGLDKRGIKIQGETTGKRR